MQVKKDAKPVTTSDPTYDLLYGGYIDPENLLEPEDAKKVKDAVNTIINFFVTLEGANLIEEI